MKVVNSVITKNKKGEAIRIITVKDCDKQSAKAIRFNLKNATNCEVQMHPCEVYEDRKMPGYTYDEWKGYYFTIFLNRPLLTGEV